MAQADLKARRRHNYKYFLEYRTRWADNDMYDHLNNNVYYYLFDSIVNSYLISNASLHPPTSPVIGLVVHSHCDYFGPISFPSVVDVGLRVNKLGTSSVTYEIGVFERGVEEVKAVGCFIHVFINRENNRPLKDGMREETKEALGKLLVTQDRSKL